MQDKTIEKKKILITLIQIGVIGILVFWSLKSSSSPIINEMFGGFDPKKGLISLIVISIFYLSLYLINKAKGKK